MFKKLAFAALILVSASGTAFADRWDNRPGHPGHGHPGHPGPGLPVPGHPGHGRLSVVFTVTQRDEASARDAAIRACEDRGHGRLNRLHSDMIDFGKHNGVIVTYQCAISERDRDNMNYIPVVVTHRTMGEADSVLRNTCNEAIRDNLARFPGQRAFVLGHDSVDFGAKNGIVAFGTCSLTEWDNTVPSAVTSRTYEQASQILRENCRQMNGMFRERGSDLVDFGSKNGYTVYGLCQTRQ